MCARFAARGRDVGRQSQPFKLKPAEAAALEAARVQFLAWHEGMPPMRPKVLTDLGEAARNMSKALAPLLDSGGLNPTRARLLVRMQMIELHQKPQDHYHQLLTWASYTASLIDRAVAPEVRRGNKADERAHSWVRTAARHWLAVGLKVTKGGRFRSALTQFHHAGIPLVSDRDQISLALDGLGE